MKTLCARCLTSMHTYSMHWEYRTRGGTTWTTIDTRDLTALTADDIEVREPAGYIGSLAAIVIVNGTHYCGPCGALAFRKIGL